MLPLRPAVLVLVACALALAAFFLIDGGPPAASPGVAERAGASPESAPVASVAPVDVVTERTAAPEPGTDPASESGPRATVRIELVGDERFGNADSTGATAAAQLQLVADLGRGPLLASLPLEGAGAFDLEIPAARLVPDAAGLSDVVVLLRAPGLASPFVRAEVQGRTREGAPRARASLYLHPGSTFDVRLVDDAGTPVDAPATDARFWRRWDSGDRPRSVIFGDDATRVAGAFERGSMPLERGAFLPRGDGVYTLSVPQGGMPDAVVVEAKDVGSGRFQVSDAREAGPDPLTVRLGGPGAVLLRVVDSAGAPVRGLDVVLTTAPGRRPEPYTDDPWSADPESMERETERGLGRVLTEARTDAEGRVLARGLAQGTFHVLTERASLDEYPHVYDELVAVTSEAEPSETVCVYDRARLVVEVPATDGAPKSARVVVVDAGPADSVAFVRPEMPGPRRRYWQDAASAPIDATVGGTVSFFLPPGRHYCARLASKGRAATPRLVTLGPAPAVEHVTLDPGDLQRHGTLEVIVHVPDRDPYADGDASTRYAVWAEDAATAFLLAEARERNGLESVETVSFEVPAGRVRVAADGVVESDPHHGTVWGTIAFARAETTVDVREGETTRAELLLRAGGRLEIVVPSTASSSDVAAFVAHEATLSRFNLEEPGEYLGVSMHLEHAERRTSLVVSRIGMAMMGSSAAGDHTLCFWPLGETHVTEPLPAGTYTLRSTQVTRGTVEQQVTVVEGATTRVVLDFGG